MPSDVDLTLVQLCNQLKQAKSREREANEARIVFEEALVDYLKKTGYEIPDSGQATFGADSYKFKVVNGYNYKMDATKVKEICKAAGLGNHPPIKQTVKEELYPKAWEWYRTQHPAVFAKLTSAVEAKPKKTAVTFI